VENPIEAFALGRPEDDMYMIWHDAPRVQRVPSYLEMVKILDDGVSKLGIPQMTFAALDMQLVIESQCERLLNVESLDCCRLAQAAGYLAGHRSPFIA